MVLVDLIEDLPDVRDQDSLLDAKEITDKLKKLDLENTINQAHNDAEGALKAYSASKKSLES